VSVSAVRVVAFVDLDDSLFQTRPKCPPGEPCEPAALARDGSPLSYMTARQRALFDRLATGATLVPTTARNLDAFRRVRLPFAGDAVLDFGGVIVRPDGTPDPEWDAHVRPRADAAREPLEAALGRMRELSQSIGADVTGRLIRDFGLPLYVVAKHPDRDTDALRRVRNAGAAEWAALGLRAHLNDNNFALLPAYLGKEHAVRFLLGRWRAEGPVLALGLGDGLSDAAFLAECDYALTPTGGQLFAEAVRGI
jgi:hypothetical protein